MATDILEQIGLEDPYEPKYYHLKKGEIVQDGDEVEMSNSWNDPAKWVRAVNSIGQPAPDPQFPAHRKFRRLVK